VGLVETGSAVPPTHPHAELLDGISLNSHGGGEGNYEKKKIIDPKKIALMVQGPYHMGQAGVAVLEREKTALRSRLPGEKPSFGRAPLRLYHSPARQGSARGGVAFASREKGANTDQKGENRTSKLWGTTPVKENVSQFGQGHQNFWAGIAVRGKRGKGKDKARKSE